MTAPASKQTRRRRFKLRGLITYLLALSFFVLVISGVVNFLAPSGRIARQIDWSLLGLDRIAWQSLHLSFAAVFIIIALVHLAFNWHGLLHYLRDRASRHLTLKWEAAVAVAITLVLISSAVLALPPASNLHDLTAQFRRTFWTDGGAAPGRGTAPTGLGQKESIPATDSPSLPQGHPPVPPDKPCSGCHRGQ